MKTITVFSPAKLNLYLAVTGRRPDGYHDLLSVACPLEWGDTLTAEQTARPPGASAEPDFPLECTDPAVPLGEDNLVRKAGRAFRAATKWRGNVRFRLEKVIPMGAGLGGGSSNAVAALRLLNELAERPLEAARLSELATELGSDCPLFLARAPVLMRGRGEKIEAVPKAAAARLRGRRVLVFKPDFSVATAWAYARLATRATYVPPAEAESQVAAWLADAAAPVEDLLFNSLEGVVFEKFVALPALIDELQRRFGLQARMSGSGSACFALLPPAGGPPAAAVSEAIRSAWGPSTFVVETTLR